MIDIGEDFVLHHAGGALVHPGDDRPIGVPIGVVVELDAVEQLVALGVLHFLVRGIDAALADLDVILPGHPVAGAGHDLHPQLGFTARNHRGAVKPKAM